MKNDYWNKRLANEYWNIYNNSAKYQKELIKIYNKASDEIIEELYKISAKFEENGVISRSEFYKAEHLKRMEKGFNGVLSELGEKVEDKGTAIILNAGEDVVKKTGKSLGIEINYNEDLAKKLMQTDWKGSNFSKRVWKNSKKLENELNTQVKKGILTGKPTSQIAIELDKSMGVGLSNSARLVRTETMHHMNDVNLQHMKSAGIQQVEEVVTLDERTSSECQPHHGRVWDIDKAPHLPRHPHCRCVLVAHIDVDKMAAEFDRREKEILLEEAKKEAYVIAERMGLYPLKEETVVNVLRVQSKEWIKNLSNSERKSIIKYSGNGVDSDGMKLYQKINNSLRGLYVSKDEKETEIITRNAINIQSSILKNKNTNDIILYRYQDPKYELKGTQDSFTSTSVVSSTVMGDNIPNHVLIVSKEVPGAYIEYLSEYPEQKELLLAKDVFVDDVKEMNGIFIKKVIYNGR